ncbi:MAG: hypothetical protein A3K19_16790 [Lentisphaerae bacterium RIFOXYB12_FULL_65_16]|nr:MAG: hypothetical protein A3K18_26620 [Lentisphaerae bacterium RIFOXYA12_64_32]OGV88975.1 MAG: hypothetical protein A3K19_16790 [Lentisphaerae bacterium RIFOXYB12_FULL_65_16]
MADATILLVKSCLLERRYDDAAQALDFHAKNSQNLTDGAVREALVYWRAVILLGKGDIEAAIAQVQPLADSAQTPEFRIRALGLIGDAYVRLEKWDLAETALMRLLNESPDVDSAVRAQVGLVKIFLARKSIDRATQVLNDVRTRYPDRTDPALVLCQILILLNQNNIDEAFKLYRTVEPQRPLRPDPDWWLVTSRLGTALVDAGRLDDALLVLPQATALAGTRDERIHALLQSAEVMITLGKVELAINALESFRKEYVDRPEVIPVLLKLAELLQRTKNFVTASEYFEDVSSNEKAPADLRYRAALSRGWCFLEVKQHENAAQAFARAAKFGQTPPEQAEALFLAGDASFRVESFTNAALYYGAVADNYTSTSFAEEARLRQAQSRAKAKLFSNAAGIYKQFLDEFPNSKLRETARLERGIALRSAGDCAVAMTELFDLASGNPSSPNAPCALMEAYEAARGADDIPQAIRMLTLIIDKYSDSKFYPDAIYQRAHVRFFQADYEPALADCQLFLEKFPTLELATDVLLWLGDHYANIGKPEKSEEYFIRIVTEHVQSPHAPTALYEAAKNAFHRDDLVHSRALLQQLAQQYPEASVKIRAQAELLQGDMLAKEGKYADAIPHFLKAQELAAESPLGLSALGRLGEMYYSLDTQDPEKLKLAVGCFEQVASSQVAPPELRELAQYRLAKCGEKMGQTEAAIQRYLDIVYSFEGDRKGGSRMRDWFYFARSGYDVARLLVLNERFREAARVYERLASSGIPTAADARQKAREIREAHKLND